MARFSLEKRKSTILKLQNFFVTIVYMFFFEIDQHGEPKIWENENISKKVMN